MGLESLVSFRGQALVVWLDSTGQARRLYGTKRKVDYADYSRRGSLLRVWSEGFVPGGDRLSDLSLLSSQQAIIPLL